MKVLDLFSGIGGFSLGLERAGMETTAFCESDAKCRAVLGKHWPTVPCHQDVRTLDATTIDADLICGGFPCQPFSTAARGRNNAIDLWPEYLRVIREARPRWVVAENVPGIGDEGVERVAGGLEREGYYVWAMRVDTSPPGRSRERMRVFWLAYADSESQPRFSLDEEMARVRLVPRYCGQDDPAPVGMGDGVSGRMDRLRQLGNSVSPYASEIIGRAIMTAENSFASIKDSQ